MKIQQFVVTSLLLVFGSASELSDTKALIQKFELNANASKVLQREDRRILSEWASEYQVKRLDVSMKYRMQMVKHEEHSFRINGNVKWAECLFHHRKDIRRAKQLYHQNELECLKSSTSKDADNIHNVEQLEKEIMNWRKGYKHLVNLCELENPSDDNGAENCLVEYMQNDKYDEVIERLMILKQTAVSSLYAYYNASLVELDECLKMQLSRYLERVRAVMDVLNRCYAITT